MSTFPYSSRPGLNNQKMQTEEILGLCSTLNYEICAVFNQNLEKPNPTYYIGIGKVEEITQFIESQPPEKNRHVQFVVFDCPLKASQIFNLENAFHVRVLDRNALILMIFLHHARTNEAKLQVEYAILNHQIPYVTELVRRSKLGEHPGFLGGGEYQVDDYYELTRRRIRKIRKDLEKIKISREQRRRFRHRSGFELITLAGYTNAGKSALLNALTRANILVDDQLFSTVSPRTRRFRNSKILVTDTVGFIRNLPTQLVEAFKSTLEEIIFADYIILVVDISEEQEIIIEKLRTSLNIIDQLMTETFELDTQSIQKSEVFAKPKYHLVYNKYDLTPDAVVKSETVSKLLGPELTAHGISSHIIISCKTKFGLDELITKLFENE